MEVITTHTNADFDTFASMVAAKKLYPEARLVFSGSVEKKLSEALKTIALPCRLDRIKDIDLHSVTRLILVDVRHPSRIGPFQSIATRPGLDIHIYDHHPSTPGDLSGSVEEIAPWGSTTTVLVHVLKRKGIRVTAEEATILMAGIYEDTGFLSYPSTTVADFEAASYLLSSGADLSAVSNLLKRELSADEVALLNEFLHSETAYSIGGVEVVIAEGYLEKYSGDISILAHKMSDIEGMNALFMLVDSGDRVHVIARSRTLDVDAGKVLREMGGGGHPYAASATVKAATLVEAREALLKALRRTIVPKKTAADIMSFPPITVEPDTLVRDAVLVMRRYNINAVPVVKDGVLSGVITRQVADKAFYHGLGASPAGDYMTTECVSVPDGASVDEIREKVVAHGQRLLPVIKDERVAGVITRTDLLKLLQEELKKRPGREVSRTKHLANLLKERLPEWLYGILIEAGVTADALGVKAYLVGGFVRDLLLRRDNLDVDIVIERGDGIVFAEEFASMRGLRVKTHQRFKTAVLVFPDGFKVDVATARLEYYERPGSLPTVEESSLKLDLYRRDFIMNTLAVALNPSSFGELIDFFGAEKDIKEKTIRVLHNLSFIEDPTRALRAVRFSEKFGFRIERHTLNLIKNGVRLDFFRSLSGARLCDEFRNILEEEAPVKALRRLYEIGLLSLIHPGITWDREREAFLERAHEALAWHRLLYTKEKAEGWLVLFLSLTDPLKEEDMSSLIRRLMISGKKRLEVLNSRSSGLKALNRIETGLVKKGSALYGLLKPLPLEVILYLTARAAKEDARKALSNYITKLKSMETHLKGDDLKKMGIREGRRIGEILRELLEKRLDGEITTRAGEERFARSSLKASKRKR